MMANLQNLLTDEAKELARWMVEKWDKDTDFQTFIAFLHRGGIIYIRDEMEIHIASIEGLTECGLISHKPAKNGRDIKITLKPIIRKAVANDFVMPDEQPQVASIHNNTSYGAYFAGDVNGSNIQAGTSVYGNVIFNQVASELEAALGQEILEEFSELRQAIDELRKATEADKQSKLGKVISELGNGLQHGANAITISQAAIAFRILFFGG